MALAEESIRQAEGRVAESRAAFLPDLESSVQERRQTTNLRAFGFTFTFPTIPGVPAFVIPNIVGPFTVFDARATAQQSVFSFSDIRKHQSNRTSLAATRSDFDATKDQVSNDVARKYLACLRADATEATARANVELSDALLQQAQRLKSAGTGTGIEVTRAQVQLANDRQKLIAAVNDRSRSVFELLKAMGLRLDAQVDFTDKLDYHQADASSIEAELGRAKKTRAELRAQQQREEAARLSFGSVKAERLPSVAASADYGTIGQQLVGAQPTYTLGIAVKVPVFDGGKREARRGESFSQYQQEKVRTRDLEDQIELEVRTAIDSLRSAASEVDAAREGLALAESELAQARRRYDAGVGTSVEVTDAQTRLQRARDNQTAALYSHNLARLDLASATGTIREFVNQ